MENSGVLSLQGPTLVAACLSWLFGSQAQTNKLSQKTDMTTISRKETILDGCYESPNEATRGSWPYY